MSMRVPLFAPVPLFAINAGHEICFWNAACAALTGLSAELAMGTRAHREVFAPSGGPTLADALLDAVSGIEAGGEAAHSPAASSPVHGLAETLAALLHCPPADLSPWSVAEGGWLLRGQALRAQKKLRLDHIAALYGEGANRMVVQAVLPCPVQRAVQEVPAPQTESVADDYRTLAENIGDGFLLNQDERLILVNQAFARLLGYDRVEELIGRHIAELIAPSHREAFLRKHHGKLGGLKVIKNTWPHLTRDGGVVWLEGHPKRIIWNGKQAILSTLVDVTESHEREERMEREAARLRMENTMLKSSLLKNSYKFHNMVGKSAAMRDVYELLMRAANDMANVIIYGESGTGKELAAHAIHELGLRAKGPFVAVNCGAIPAELLESEFFGVKRGAFTGAYADKSGYFDEARHGTLFLDEVGDLPLNLQVKLLRVIDSGSYQPVGSPETRKADARILAATNRNLVEEVAAGRFREDLFYRLHVIPIHLPPLRARKEDIPLLLEYVATRYASRPASHKEPPIFPRHVLEKMYAYAWPGNVREFINTVQRYMTLGVLDLIHKSAGDKHDRGDPAARSETGSRSSLPSLLPLKDAIARCEKETVEAALREADGNRAQAARLLGISRRHLYRKLGE